MQKHKVSCLELFSGAGGLAAGLRRAGTQHRALVEWNNSACSTLMHNYGRDIVHRPVENTKAHWMKEICFLFTKTHRITVVNRLYHLADSFG